ncbi:AAA family ATPase [Planktothricoides raciborskii]|uniref:AAA family ATPase n=1 Tax=Planktothricoides raciborskii FACHB-1370 TaxID=2949576 RepID=A0ABR8EL52_9CYAN|nr:AAA family ATPase [Planktothricoides raciborskii]MBD2546615.1 AAA family ATPase [Planktothricoides raciborskii FACHB-1370]MBD2585129.1 AAA family ATPase [Planktothricoides raciborskii FACHB-1261]
MKLIIKNLGSIKNNSQAIDLAKDFFVFVGRNNSGKSYVAQLLWTIFNEDVIEKFAKNNLDIIQDDLLENANEVELNPELIDKIIKKYSAFLAQHIKRFTFNIGKKSEVLSNIIIEFIYEISELKRTASQAIFNIQTSEGNSINYLAIKKQEDSLLFQIEDKQKELPEDFFDFVPRKIFTKDLIQEKKSVLITSIIRMLLKHQHQTFFLPASRSFFPIFYSYIYQIERKEREQIVNKLLTLMETKNNEERIKLSELQELNIGKRPYTEPMNQVIENLYSLNDNQEIQNQEFYLNIVQKLQEIMGGEITPMSQEGIAPIELDFKLNINGNSLPMYLASSSVNQLTLLYLYLKYWVGENNNFLMMDEPEENLHPENQINLLNILLQFVSARDNKVLITTHSPILANAINNYIYLDVLKNEYKIKVKNLIEEHELKYVDTDVSISKEKVGVYFFTGDKIIDYESGDYGIYFRNFREVENNLEKSLRILSDYIYLQEDDSEDE